MSYILVEYSLDEFGSGIFETLNPMTNDAGTKIEVFKTEEDAIKTLYQLMSYVPDDFDDENLDITIDRIH